MQKSIPTTNFPAPLANLSSSLGDPSFGEGNLAHLCFFVIIEHRNTPNEKQHCLYVAHYLHQLVLDQLESFVREIVPAMDFPNCLRSLVYLIAVSYTPMHTPTAIQQTRGLECFKTLLVPVWKSVASGSLCSYFTFTSLSVMLQFWTILNPSLFLIT